MTLVYLVVTVNQITIDECFFLPVCGISVLPSESIRICLKRSRQLQSIHDPDLPIRGRLDNQDGCSLVFQYDKSILF